MKEEVVESLTQLEIVTVEYIEPIVEEEEEEDEAANNSTESEKEPIQENQIEEVPLETDVVEETTDFGEIDNTVFAPPPPPTLDNWEKPKPKLPKIDFSTGEIFVPPPVKIKNPKVDEKGGMSMEFERPVLVPPFFKGKGKKQNKRRNLEEIQSFDEADSATSDALKEILTFKI